MGYTEDIRNITILDYNPVIPIYKTGDIPYIPGGLSAIY